MLSNNEPALMESLYDRDDVWDAYDGRGRLRRRLRWVVLVVAWVIGGYRLAGRLVGRAMGPRNWQTPAARAFVEALLAARP